jgi:ABC-type sugar transport system substrate-binding protein
MDELFLFLAPGETERHVVEHSGLKSLFAWVPDADTAARIAAEEATAGVRLIELYRGFDLETAAVVVAAVGGRAPVGVAGHGSGTPHAQRIGHSVMIYHDPEANAAVDRFTRTHADGSRTTVVAVPDAPTTSDVALELSERGADLIEICGGTPLTTAAEARAATANRTPVTVVTWPFESLDGVHAYKSSFENSHT